jgi:hypothetical protein
MKPYLTTFAILILCFTFFYSCQKEELFKSEKKIKSELQGTWSLIPIPRYDSITNPDNTKSAVEHTETWNFNDTKVTIVNNGVSATSTYSVSTGISKAEFKLDGVTPAFIYPARIREINGTWQIVQLDDDILIIANDQDGRSGLTELEFKR